VVKVPGVKDQCANEMGKMGIKAEEPLPLPGTLKDKEDVLGIRSEMQFKSSPK